MPVRGARTGRSNAMTSEDFRLPLTPHGEYSDSGRVRLRGDRTDVYDLAKANSEGWVRARSHDPVGGFRMVLIEWDEKHWTYNGQGNMWTYEDHFEPVQEQEVMSKDDDELRAALKVIAAKLGDDKKEADPVEDDVATILGGGDDEDPDAFTPATNDEYLSTLKQAMKAASQAEGFVLIAVGTEEHPQTGRPVLAPHIFKADKTEEASLLVGTHLHQLGLMAHQELAFEAVTAVLQEKAESEPEL